MAKWYFNEETETFHCDALYFIQEGFDGPIKIGRGANVMTRLNALQTGNPQTLRIKAEVPNAGYNEIFWHEVFKDCRIRGEWFKPTTELCRAIEWAAKGQNWVDEVSAPEGICQYHYSELMLDAYDIFQDYIFSDMSPRKAADLGMREVTNSLANVLASCPKGGCDPDEQHLTMQEIWNRLAALPVSTPHTKELSDG